MTYHCGLNESLYYCWWKEKIAKIEYREIQVGSNSKPKSLKFISFLLLIDKFSYFKWFTNAVLIKVLIIINKKKQLQKVNNYDCKYFWWQWRQEQAQASRIYQLFITNRSKLSKWLTTMTLIMKNAIVMLSSIEKLIIQIKLVEWRYR